MDLSIITVTYNSVRYLPTLLESLKVNFASLSKSGYEYEVLLVDNGSMDGSCELAASILPEIRLIRNTQNTGFAEANNQGILQSKGRYVLLLNPDARLMEENLAGAIKFMDRPENRSVGMMGCKILNPDGSMQPSCYYKPTILTECASAVGLAHFVHIPRWTTNEIPPSGFYNQVQEIDSVLGAYLFFRREVINLVGLMDSSTFFFYGEELDWGIRAREAGWCVVYTPHISMIHYGRQRIGDRMACNGIQLYKSKFKLISKHYGPGYTLLLRLVTELGLILRVVFIMLFSVLPSKRRQLQNDCNCLISLLRWNTRTLLQPAAVL